MKTLIIILILILSGCSNNKEIEPRNCYVVPKDKCYFDKVEDNKYRLNYDCEMIKYCN